MLLSCAKEKFLNEAGLANKTKREYNKFLTEFVNYKDIELEKITRQDIAEFKATLNCLPRATYDRIKAIKSLLRFFYTSYGLDVLDPVRIPNPMPAGGHWGYLTEDEIYKILDYLEHKDTKCSIKMHCAICLMFSTGCRIDELVNIKTNQIDWNRNEIELIITKTKKPRVVYLNKQTIDSLKRWIALGDSSEYLFPSRGGHLSCKAIRTHMEKIGKTLNIKNCHPHAIRKGLAQKLLNDGTDVAYIQKFLGHEKLNTTQNYISIDPEKLRQLHQRSFGSHELYFSKKVNGKLILELKGMATQNYSKLNRAIQRAIDEVI